MFKKLLTIMIMLFLSASMALGQPSIGTTYHEIQIVDEERVNVDDITSVSIYNAGTTTEATIYAGRFKANLMTNPVTTTSTNSTLASGFISWWGSDLYSFSMTDGTNVHTNSGHRNRTASEARITFPSYLSSTSSTTYTSAQSITMGDGAAWVINAGTVTSDTITFIPASDNADFQIGVSGAGQNSDFNVWVGAAIGLEIDAGVPSFVWDGGVASINPSSDFVTNINTGTSTGAINIGNSAAGAIAIDSTSTLVVTADASIDIQTADTSGDIDVDATDGSVIIDAGEAGVEDAIVIVTTGAASGIDITSLHDIDITTTGTTGEDITITNTGGTIILNASEDVTDAIDINASAGGIDIDATGEAGQDIVITNTGGSVGLSASEADAAAISIQATAGGIDIDAIGASAGDMTVNVGDDLTITTTGNAAFVTTGSLSLGSISYKSYINIVATHASISAGQTGVTFVTTAAAGSQFLELPTAAAGLVYTFIDISATAGDSIEGEVVDAWIHEVGDALPANITLLAVNTGSWVVLSKDGTWLGD